MCGRFIQISNPEKIRIGFSEIIFDSATEDDFTPRYNISPSQEILTILNHEKPEMIFTRWGLIPFWAKDGKIGSRMFNARAETLHEKPSFRDALIKKRCIIPADGFYEWKKSGKAKTPNFIHMKDGKPFALAGLWDRWIDRATGNSIASSTIITTTPNSLIEDIHDRMPAILRPEHYALWLSPSRQPAQTLMNCLMPAPADAMIAYEVSPMVNNPANNSPECINHLNLKTSG